MILSGFRYCFNFLVFVKVNRPQLRTIVCVFITDVNTIEILQIFTHIIYSDTK